MGRPVLCILTAGVQGFLGAAVAWAAPLPAADQADVRRAFAMSTLSSDEPALRQERKTREPSPAFRLGAALGAWNTAHAQLEFDLANPQGAGPPHMSQAGADEDAIGQDCADEKTAFSHLEAGAGTLSLSPAEAVSAAGAKADLASAWQARRTAKPAPACRQP